jgi:hypothetical protein
MLTEAGDETKRLVGAYGRLAVRERRRISGTVLLNAVSARATERSRRSSCPLR